MTLGQAKALKRGDVLHHKYFKNVDGTPERWRVNGMVKTWKRNPHRIKVPLKYGLWCYAYLTQLNLDDFELAE